MKLSEAFSSVSAVGVRFYGIVLILVVGAADYLTSPEMSFAVFYVLPIGFVTWYGGRMSGFVCAGLATVASFFANWAPDPEFNSAVEVWNAAGRLGIFLAVVLMLGHIHQRYASRLQNAVDQYIRIAETAIEGVVATDKTGRIEFVNTRGASLLGHSASSLVGRDLLDFVNEDGSRSLLQLSMGNGVQAPGPFEVQFVKRDGTSLWALVSASRLNPGERGFEGRVFLLTDISERKKSEEELRWRYREISAMQRLSFVLAQSMRLDRQLEVALATVMDVTGFEAGGVYLLNEATNELVIQRHRGLSQEFFEYVKRWPAGRGITGKVAQTGQPCFIEDASADDTFDNHARSIGDVRGFASIPLISRAKVLGVLDLIIRKPYRFSEDERIMLQTFGKQIGIALQNATFYQAARERERQVRQLSIDLVNVQEEERRRFARELHDGLSQLLSTLKINAELAARNYRVDPASAEKHLQEAITLADEAQAEAKQIAYDLRPAILDDFGLKAAVSTHSSKFERRTGISVDLHLPDDDVRFTPIVETTVYRIIQELLINVAKHAHASSVTIQLLVRNGVLALTVADNGKGFDVMQALSSNSDRRPHYGLRNVRERVEFLGGTFRAESSSTHGTDCMIERPIGLAALHQEKRDQVA